jgi:hypothetical protein
MPQGVLTTSNRKPPLRMCSELQSMHKIAPLSDCHAVSMALYGALPVFAGPETEKVRSNAEVRSFDGVTEVVRFACASLGMRPVNPCSLIFILRVSGLGTYYLPPRDPNPSCGITSKDSPYIESRQTSIFFRIVSKRLAPTPPLFWIPAVNRRPMSRLSSFCKNASALQSVGRFRLPGYLIVQKRSFYGF